MGRCVPNISSMSSPAICRRFRTFRLTSWTGSAIAPTSRSLPLAELREQFVPRRVYGDYLQDLLFWQAQPLAGPGRVQIDLIDDEVVDVAPTGGARRSF